MELELEKITLPLRVNWKISRNSSTEKHNYIFTLRDEGRTVLSEIAPNIRYGETHENIEAEFARFRSMLAAGESYPAALDAFNWRHSLRFALESAWVKLSSMRAGQELGDYIKAPRLNPVATSMSVPIMDPQDVAPYLKEIGSFPAYKIKVSRDTAWEMVSAVAAAAPGIPLRIDGNEAWEDLSMYLRFQDQLKGLPVEFIEQPFPAARKDLYLELHDRTSYVIMADESIEDHDNLAELATMFRAVNIKLMKTGSLLKGRDFLIKARSLGLKTMVGCMVETSLGISYAMHLTPWMDWADLDGFLLLKKDPFGLVTEDKGTLKLT